jgi:hypothetical protein
MNLRLVVLLAAIAAVAAYGIRGTQYSDAACATEATTDTVEEGACQAGDSASFKITCTSNAASSAWVWSTYAGTECAGTGAVFAAGNNSETCVVLPLAQGSLRIDCGAAASVTATILAPVLAVVAVILSKRL